MSKAVSVLFLYACLFPWVSFRILDLDIQPYFILLGVFVLMLNFRTSFRREICLLIALGVTSIVVAVAYGELDFLAMRAVAAYFSLFIVSSACYIVLKKHVYDLRFHLYFANFVWLIAGLIQVIVGKNALAFLVVARTTDNRGVTGLSPEPTYYGVYLLFLAWLVLKANEYSPRSLLCRMLIVLNVLFIVFVAKSSMGLLMLLYLLALYCFFSYVRGVKSVVFVLFVVSFLVLAWGRFEKVVEGTRLGDVVELAKSGPLYMVQADESISERVKHVVYPLHGAVGNWWVPGGYHRFLELSPELDRYYNGLFGYVEKSTRIMSGFGAAVYELGFFSLFCFLYVACSLFVRSNRKVALFEFVGSVAMMFAAIPINFPLFSMLLVLSYFRGTNPRKV